MTSTFSQAQHRPQSRWTERNSGERVRHDPARAYRAVGTVTLNRTKALNALNTAMLAAGADIKEMRPRTYIDMFASDFLAGWERLAAVRKRPSLP